MFTKSISNHRALAIAIAVVAVLSTATAYGQDTLLINYQGYLTDDAGDPITGTPSMTFAIHDAGGVSKWSETHPSVQVTNGLFSVILGSQTGMPDSVFNGEDRHLGISVDGDDEIVPRTQLTSAPSAAVSRRLAGDIRTAPGVVLVESNTDDSAVVLRAEGDMHVIELHPPDPCVPPDPCEPALEMIAEPDNHIFRVHPPEPCVPPEPCGPAFEVKAETDSTRMTISSGGDSGPGVRVYTNGTTHAAYLYVHVDDSDNEPGGDSGPALLASVDRDESSITTSWWEQISSDSSWTTMGSNTSGAIAEVRSTKDAVGHTAVAMAADDVLAQLTLLNGDPAGPADVVMRALPDGGGQIGINTDAPAEALDVVGTTRTTGFKMQTGATDGHVLTSDGDGNGTWQAPASGSRCGESGEYDGIVNTDLVETDPDGVTTVNFSAAFTTVAKPHMYVTVVLKGSANGLGEGAAIKAVEDVKGSVGNWTGFDITVSKHSDGSSIDDATSVYVTWMAIRP
jgi:hypothetical protein